MFRRRFVVLAIVALLAACGGGGGGGGAVQAPSTTTPTTGSSSLPAGYAQASFTITIPSSSSASARARHAAAGTRRPKTVPAGTQSITFTLLKSSDAGATIGVASPVYALVEGAPGCTGGAETGPPLTCTLQLQAPIGEDIYLASVYSNANGTGYNGSGATYINVQNNAVNTASLTLSGTVASVYLSTNGSFSSENVGGATVEAACLTLVPSVPQSECVSGAGGTIPASVRIFVVGLDASGNQIITPDTFGAAVVLTIAWNAVDYAGMFRRHNAAQRRPLDGGDPTPTPNPEPNPEDIVQLTDTPTSGTGGSTSPGTPTLTVTAPSDQVTATVIGTTAQTFELQVTATVNGTPQSSLVALQTYQNACVPDYGTPPFECTSGPTPTPTATPTLTPLSWGNEPGNYDGFEPTGGGNATLEAGWDPNLSFTPYTLEVDESGATSGDTITVNALACDGALVEVAADEPISGTPAPSPSPSPTNTSIPTPNPSGFTATSNSSNPGFTFYVPVAPQPTTCPVTASDGVGDQVTLTFSFTEGSITVQKHARQSLVKGTHK
jgi:hypothetical protein